MLRFFIVSLTAIFVAGCASSEKADLAKLKSRRPHDIPSVIRQCQPQCITSYGMVIYRLGNQVKLVLPGEYMFYDNSAHFKPFGYLMMNHAVSYINYFDKSTIQVAAYTDNQFGKEATQPLTAQRAQNVVNYLRKQALIANLVYSDGQGGRRQVAYTPIPPAQLANNRIELTFRYHGYLYKENSKQVLNE